MHIHASAPSGTLITIAGRWELQSLLGKGSFAKVYKAKNTSNGQLAAIKAIAADKIVQEKILQSLQSEINILRAVIHPNIVKLLDYHRLQHDPEGRPAVTHYLVLEYCDGGDLADFLESRKRTGSRGLDEDTTRRLLRMLAMGLREMHSRNIVHRDLKPGNILLASQGAHVAVKIADFGFARALEPAHLASTLCGSPLYMAPEVLSEQQYDSRSDLWSVGVMMFEMLVGHVPFSGNNIVHLKKVIDSNEAFLPFDRREQLSPACQDLVKRLLQKDPNARLPFAAFFSHPFLSGQPLHHLQPLPDTPEIYVDEPLTSAIEEDYVILSIPAHPNPQKARDSEDKDDNAEGPSHSRHAVQSQFEAHASISLTQSDPILAAHASSLPCTLSHTQWMYVTAMCIAELADWKLVNSVPAAAVHLSMLAAYLHDRVLTSLAPGFVQAQVSDVSSDLIHGPQSPCYLTTAPTDDSDSDAHPAYHCGQSQPHSSGLDPHGPGTDSGPGSSHRYAAAGEGAGAGADDKGLGALLRCVAKQDELICRCSFTHLRCLLQRGSDLASKLLTQQPSMGLPPLLPLLWQGMLSFASSAALDEMFGAHASAAKGYAKAAILAELLQRHSTDAKGSTSSHPKDAHTRQHGPQSQHVGPALAPPSAASSSGDVQPPCSSSSELLCTDSQRCLGHQSAQLRGDEQAVEVPFEQPTEQGHAQKSPVTSGSALDGMLFPDDMQGSPAAASSQLAGWGWALDQQQQQQLQGYVKTICVRHAACLRPR